MGDLEAAIMQVLWSSSEPATVRDVMGRLQTPKPLAYTTVMTVLDNLHRKREVEREMQGRAWSYRPARTRAEHSAALLQEVLQHAGDSQAVLMHFVADLGPDEITQLQQAVAAAQERGGQ
ncbi:BlaI/MecI/CopY family transcriptional regulator [Klenkia sp. PcliD-1-E]|uniref:BlaI/MecI/CopY family transcriptional regulator n=1 Tax=Klenkia sp. PcliD-1-E TaxID=2954492 RepID=UPI0020973B28|nr:BlaI/MecI/CopY family transcriptional regulator [Klenkia sp. PcliD-1-E]MCO7218309.1 BlaI/MecI/CopY family transcriptional regulator [Klenkia sp. PcliD-1-E]